MLPNTILPIIKELQGYTVPQKFPMMIPIPIEDTQILKRDRNGRSPSFLGLVPKDHVKKR